MATRKGLKIDFMKEGGMVGSTTVTGVAPVATAAAVNNFSWGGKTLLFTNIAQNDDISPSKHASLGWVIPNDNTDDDGVEINTGIEATSNPCAFVVGTDPTFYVSLKFNIPDVSDYDIVSVGFRKAAAHSAIDDVGDYTAYTDYFYLSVTSGAYTVYSANDGSDVVDDLTNSDWLDTETHTLRVEVDASGNATAYIDGVAAGGQAAFAFDSGDTLIPSIVFAKGAAASDTPPVLQVFDCGLK